MSQRHVNRLNSVFLGFNTAARIIHDSCLEAGWYDDLETGQPIDRNVGEMFMLFVTEIAEGYEGVRRNLMDDHLPHRKMEEVELADVLIRVLDYCAYKGLDIEGALREKFEYNQHRADHKVENRKKPNGKKT